MKFLDIFKKKENDCCNIKIIDLDEEKEYDKEKTIQEEKNNEKRNTHFKDE